MGLDQVSLWAAEDDVSLSGERADISRCAHRSAVHESRTGGCLRMKTFRGRRRTNGELIRAVLERQIFQQSRALPLGPNRRFPQLHNSVGIRSNDVLHRWGRRRYSRHECARSTRTVGLEFVEQW